MDLEDVPYRFLREITDDFSEKRKLGEGPFGVVYKGETKNGEYVAVKALKFRCDDLNRLFRDEVYCLSALAHKNIVKLLGYCYEIEKETYTMADGSKVFADKIYGALCFEYLCNGSLQKHLSGELCELELDWHKRFNIIKGTCEGLKYMHKDMKNPIYHLDLNPDNILLDKDMMPKIAGFGFSRFIDKELSQNTQTRLGTIGYQPPEHIDTGEITEKFDIFSLGVVIIMIVSGPEGLSKCQNSSEFVDHVKKSWRNRLQATCTSDFLLDAYCHQVERCTQIALECKESDSKIRPTIVKIIEELNKIDTDIYKHPQKEMRKEPNDIPSGHLNIKLQSEPDCSDLEVVDAQETSSDIVVADWIDTATEDPATTASLGPMAPLLRQIQSVVVMDPSPTHVGDIKRLMEHLEVLCGDLLEPEEASSTPEWWRKEVRELLYDTEDLLCDAIHSQTGDLSEVIAGVEDAWERRQRLQLPLNKAIKPGLGKSSIIPHLDKHLFSAKGDSAGRCLVAVQEPMNKLDKHLFFDNQKQLKVVTIFGLPGVGKTTAATALYHKYRGRFQCSAFVRVSRTPDSRSLLISILSQIKAQRFCALPDVHDLLVGIKKHLKSKRYFIVMDDLWAASVWDIISRAFPDGDYGSRIITTTQIHDVALACCRYYPNYVEMSPLNDDQSRRLFFTTIFGPENHCPSDLNDISYDIVKKCAGLPLAIAIVACLLARESNLSVEKWQDTRNSLPSIVRTNPTFEGMDDSSSDTVTVSEGSQLASGTKMEKWKHTQDSLPSTLQGLKQLLSFIYSNLPPHLHTCLLYLSMYPEGYFVRKQDLVRQWVAEGFVTASKWRSAEEVAESYFDELVSSGMVQPVDTSKYDSEVLSCTVHHMVLDLIRQKSKEMNFVITVDYLQSWLALPDEVRRLSLQFGGAKSADVPENILISKVRSLLFSGFIECVPSLVDYLLLRVLILHIWADGDETSFDLTSISGLLRLRYLKIQCNIMVNLPNEISGLKHLETLEVDASLSAVPSDICHLKKLLHLHLLLPSEAIQPEGLGDVAELTNLQDLHLTFSTAPSEPMVGNMEDLGSILEKLNDLRSLTWHGAAVSRQTICDDGLRSVSPSLPRLEKLELRPRIRTLSRLPEWIGKLSRLTILKIEVWDLSATDIYTLSRLTSLAALSLAVLTENAERADFGGGFPELKYFKFVRTAPYMTFFQGAMPKLQKLKLAFNANRMEPQYRAEMNGLQHLSSLTEISVKFGCADADESNKRNAERVFREAFRHHPNINIQWVDCVFNGYKATDREDTKGQDDSRASPMEKAPSMDDEEVVEALKKVPGADE